VAIPLRPELAVIISLLKSTIRIVKKNSAKRSGKKQRRRHSIMAFEMIRLDRASD